jgi:hypothetical protein
MSWTPADITTALWLDADDSTTITESSGSVSDWADKSGNGLDVTQPTSGLRPTLSTFGGRTAMLFSDLGSGDTYFENTTDGITSGTYTGQFTVFYVVTVDDSAGGTLLTERADALVKSSSWWYPAGDFPYLSSDGLNVSSNHLFDINDWEKITSAGAILVHQHEPGERDNAWVNGRPQTIDTGTASDITGDPGFRVGRREAAFAAQPGWAGLICELIVLTDDLTVETRKLVERYLSQRWGIPLRRNLRALGLRR